MSLAFRISLNCAILALIASLGITPAASDLRFE